MVRRSVLNNIFKEMISIRQRLDDIETNFSSWKPQPVALPESTLIALPDHLRKSYSIVATKGECDAAVVSSQTGRCRAIESNYLNQLSRMGWLNKRRVSKTTHFRAVSEKMLKKPAAGKAGVISISELPIGVEKIRKK